MSLVSPDAVVVVVVVAGGGADLSVGTKPWWRTSWSSSASGHCCCLGGEVRWRPDQAKCRITHPAMRVVGPLTVARQSRHLSSSSQSASVKEMDDYNNNIDDGSGGPWPLTTTTMTTTTRQQPHRQGRAAGWDGESANGQCGSDHRQ